MLKQTNCKLRTYSTYYYERRNYGSLDVWNFGTMESRILCPLAFETFCLFTYDDVSLTDSTYIRKDKEGGAAVGYWQNYGHLELVFLHTR